MLSNIHVYISVENVPTSLQIHRQQSALTHQRSSIDRFIDRERERMNREESLNMANLLDKELFKLKN